jgi:hypothetical protein
MVKTKKSPDGMAKGYAAFGVSKPISPALRNTSEIRRNIIKS